MQRHSARQFLAVRTVFESPILDDHKWAKACALPCDALFLDLEDSASPSRKQEALVRVLAALADRETLGKPLVARANPLWSPTGLAELTALAQAGVEALACPKVRTASDLQDVIDVMHQNGADPDVLAIIETMDAVANIEEILDIPQVVGVFFGPGDLALDMGLTVHGSSGRVEHEPFLYARSRVVLAAARRGLARFDHAFVADLRDLEDLRDEATYSRRLGFTGMTAFYPSHIDVIHAVFTPDDAEVSDAEQVIAAYEEALADGSAALSIDGQGVLVHDYEHARQVVGRARSGSRR